jgi:hypothetical protein
VTDTLVPSASRLTSLLKVPRGREETQIFPEARSTALGT